MRDYIICIFLLTAIGTQAQQVNPVPDYVFRNQMSVGRNAVTDTAAYMSIGPRYGANKGLMPPIVSDTAAITGVKRNGLLIFSVQRNNFQYWDSINSRWTSVTANVDTTVISTRAWRKKGDDSLGAVIATRTDTTLLSTRAWRRKGLDSLAAIELNVADTATMLNPYTRGSGTVNYVPKFTTTRAFGNSQIFDNGTNVGINTANPSARLHVFGTNENEGDAHGQIVARSTQAFNATPRAGIIFQITQDGSGNGAYVGSIYSQKDNTTESDRRASMIFSTRSSSGTTTERMRILSDGRVAINTSSPDAATITHTARASDGTVAVFRRSGGTINPGMRIDVSETNNTVSLNPNYSGATAPALTFLTAETERLRIFANGRVGINTTTDAGYQFDVAGSMRNTTGANFATSSGSVGIGTTSPSEVLHVVGRGRFTTIDSTSSPINVLTSDVNGVIRKTAPGVQGSGTTNYVAKFTASGTVGNSSIFDNGSTVGINTTTLNPFYKLEVSGVSRFLGDVYYGASATTNSVLYLFNSSNSNYGELKFDGANNVFSIGANYGGGGSYRPIDLQTSITTRMRIQADGEVLIGTTTDAGDFRLQVNGNANFRDDVQIDTNLRVNRHITLDQTPKAWALGNAIEGPQGSTLFVAGGGVQTLANIYYDGSYKYSTSNPGAAMFLLQSGITFATYGSGTANGALTGANEMVYAGGELRVGLADQGAFKLQVADKSYFGDEVQIASTTDLGNYKLQVTGEAIITGGMRTDAPSGGTAATWKLGTVATVSPTSPNRTIEVEIGGTTYYIHAKTTNN